MADEVLLLRHRIKEIITNNKEKELEEALKKLNERDFEMMNLKQNEKKLNEDLTEADNTINFLKEKALEQSRQIQRAAQSEDSLLRDVSKLRSEIDKDQ